MLWKGKPVGRSAGPRDCPGPRLPPEPSPRAQRPGADPYFRMTLLPLGFSFEGESFELELLISRIAKGSPRIYPVTRIHRPDVGG